MAMERLAESTQTATVSTQYVLERIDAIERELQALRRALASATRQEEPQNIVQELAGSLGPGTIGELDEHDKYDMYALMYELGE